MAALERSLRLAYRTSFFWGGCLFFFALKSALKPQKTGITLDLRGLCKVFAPETTGVANIRKLRGFISSLKQHVDSELADVCRSALISCTRRT